MREFIVLGHEAPTEPDFPLDDLPSAGGRVDVLCRCVTAALLRSHGVREDVRVHLVHRDEFTVHFDGSRVRRLNPDERSTAALIRTALGHRDEAVGHVAAEAAPGVTLSRRGFESILRERADAGRVVELHEAGDPVVDVAPPDHPVFVLSDHRDFAAAEADLLAEVSDARVSLGPERLHADQAVTVAHNWLDTDGFTSY